MSEPKSKHVDAFETGFVRLTLALWDGGYGYSPEIGYRTKDGRFDLIQWSGIRQEKAWDIAKRMALKGKSASKIQNVLDRISR